MEQKIEVQDAPPKSVRIHKPDPSKSNNSYAPRDQIYVREVKGRVETLRRVLGFALMAAFALLPWLTWNGEQAILLDILDQKFRIFGLTLWPQDLTILAWIFMIGAFALFLVTTLYGRVWCGFTCPQTTWTFIFMWFERKIEGSRHQRMKLDARPMDFDKFWRKTAKHSAWLVVAVLTSMTFVGYFTDIRALFQEFFLWNSSAWATGCVLFFTFATYGNAGWMREIMCTHICPYARFQSAMFDKDTFIVAYDEKRGEPRGPRKRKADLDEVGLGHCIDCQLCVQVCPTGIDIRNGLQYECINCGACIDACDGVMDKMNYPRKLISFTTENQLEGKRTKLFRFKSVGYGLALTVLTGLLVLDILLRIPLEFDVIRDRNSLFRENQQGYIENVYTLRVINKSQEAQIYTLSAQAEGVEDLQWHGPTEITLEGGSTETIPISLAIDPYFLDTPMKEVTFTVQSINEERVNMTVESNFIYR
ncbi:MULTISPECIES: cytochrome c oxidase accessory protein CcoG [Gammaproteobacteria]|uniref:cytochrome c oxidase accessory protein CcoG n=1 Tax=Gammaproteobacteria TaxID=1236 RepID=UPI000DD01EE2|nr:MULTISPECIES: cytochrome c oxidase accessory protein CcoG [Gammaproteobacteria]RTE86760.1 cytochrome c oxidase accessory protein CcoG [Aliidiomarina sp. B3213]TCZ90686.1 cytochrome c oxidase accessory protein CcoG [Lysobacter sp. N42]